MGQFSMEITPLYGSVLGGNQHAILCFACGMALLIFTLEHRPLGLRAA